MSTLTLKGYKVSNAARDRICGIASSTLSDLLTKARSKFKIGKKEVVTLYLQDGTIIDNEEYFSTVPSQSLLTLVRKDEKFNSGVEIIYNALASVNMETLRLGREVEKFFSEDVKTKIKVLSRILKDSEESEKTRASHRSDHPEWFEGIDTRYNTKEKFMSHRCRERIRSYHYFTSVELATSDSYKTCAETRRVIDECLSEMKYILTKNSFNAAYFDRSQTSGNALCDPWGKFTCNGLWNRNSCNHNGGSGHTINPYTSKEHRIVFSTWNLDHRIERRRSVIPAMLRSATEATNRKHNAKLNFLYFYDLLFTRKNLGLVHIVCHDKGAHHNATCDPSQCITTSNKSPVDFKERNLAKLPQLAGLSASS